jgi:hypothetical protein
MFALWGGFALLLIRSGNPPEGSSRWVYLGSKNGDSASAVAENHGRQAEKVTDRPDCSTFTGEWTLSFSEGNSTPELAASKLPS